MLQFIHKIPLDFLCTFFFSLVFDLTSSFYFISHTGKIQPTRRSPWFSKCWFHLDLDWFDDSNWDELNWIEMFCSFKVWKAQIERKKFFFFAPFFFRLFCFWTEKMSRKKKWRNFFFFSFSKIFYVGPIPTKQ